MNARMSRSCKRGAVLVGLATLLAGLHGVQASEGEAEPVPPGAKAEARARALLELLVTGRYDEFVAAGNATMRAKFTALQAQQVWSSVWQQIGGYRSIESARVTAQDEYQSVSLVVRCARGEVTIRIVLNAAGELSGLWLDGIVPDWEPPAYADPARFEEEPRTVSAGEFALPATLALPKGPGPYPGVVLVHGSGPNNENEQLGPNRPFQDLAWGLASQGVAVLRYQKRTFAHPTAYAPADWTPQTEVIDDAVAAARLLRAEPRVDPQRVFVVGHSLGAGLAPLIAQQDGQLAGIVLLAGNARSLVDLVEEQTDYTVKLAGWLVPAEQKKQVAELKKALAAIRAGQAEQVTTPVLGMPAVYWARYHEIDPPARASELSLPILILQGQRDYQVTTTDYKLWQKRLAGRPRVTFKLYDELNHLFMPGTGPSSPAEYRLPSHVDERVITDLAKWIREQPPRE